MSEPSDLGTRIVALSRKARLGDITIADWTQRIRALIESQPDIETVIDISAVRALEGESGSSSGTLFFDARYRRNGKQEDGRFVLRFTPVTPLFHVYDIAGQVRLQQILQSTAVPVPGLFWEDPTGRYLQMPAYVMERVEGQAAPADWHLHGVIAAAAPEHRRAMLLDYVRTLATIHQVDWREQGLGFLADRAAGRCLIDREANWYWDALLWADEGRNMERLQPVYQWLIDHEPAGARAVLCHGDTNLTNNLFRDDRVAAVIDWEMAFIGAPECDLAYIQNALATMMREPLDGVPLLPELWAYYEQITGTKLQHMGYYGLFATWRLTCILILGARHFPADFKAAFGAFLDGAIQTMNDSAIKVGAPVVEI
ncbi:MAG: hypothetical protein JWQ90_2421 [Hydrocarboniphaga sp.]|uniref:phosphotransferase family protein n=1 Tax=Hydrocarboniphaga sp. TaxID=2033016 RepID=UPI0026228CAE|nr:phosphotransferase family protein [Hydrocarboniphaga sp.]MDB5969971.1 hypothetical protein [Hydrocarboniphaga sp.]